MNDAVILPVLLIIGSLATCAILIMEPQGASIQTDVLTIHVSERFPYMYRAPPNVITDANVLYEVGIYVNVLDLQPGYNYTIEKQQYVGKSLRNSKTNGTITRIISKEV